MAAFGKEERVKTEPKLLRRPVRLRESYNKQA